MQKRYALWIVGVSILLIAAFLVLYMPSSAPISARSTLYQLAGVSDQYAPDKVVQASLLKRFPVGTTLKEITPILEAQGIEQDHFVGGQLLRYQIQNPYHTIILLTDAPSPWLSVCGPTDIVVHLNFDRDERLQDIVINDGTTCL